MDKTVGIILSLKDKFSTPLKNMAAKLEKTEEDLKKVNLQINNFQNNAIKGFQAVSSAVNQLQNLTTSSDSHNDSSNKMVESLDNLSEKTAASGNDFKEYGSTIQNVYNYMLSAVKVFDIVSSKYAQQRDILKNLTSIQEDVKKGVSQTVSLFESTSVFLGKLKEQAKITGEAFKNGGIVQGFNQAGHSVSFLSQNLNSIIPLAKETFGTFMQIKDSIDTGVLSPLKGLQSEFTALHSVLNNPESLMAVGALVGTGIALYANWSKVVNVLTKAFNVFKSFGKKTIDLAPSSPNPDSIANKEFSANGDNILGTSYAESNITPVAKIASGGDSSAQSGLFPSDNSSKKYGKDIIVDVGGIHIQGNMVGNNEFLSNISNLLATQLKEKMVVIG